MQTLRNAVRGDRWAHAYLLAGHRGTGKTTVARLLAKAANCLGPSHRPIGRATLRTLLVVNAGTFLDLIEIDAASNTSVEDVPRIRANESTSARPGRRQGLHHRRGPHAVDGASTRCSRRSRSRRRMRGFGAGHHRGAQDPRRRSSRAASGMSSGESRWRPSSEALQRQHLRGPRSNRGPRPIAVKHGACVTPSPCWIN